MRKIWLPFVLLAISSFYLWIVPQQHRLYFHLLGTPVLWFLLSLLCFPAPENPGIWLGRRRFWPFLWVPGLFLLSLSCLGIGYITNLVVFSYGLTRPQAVKPLLLPMFAALWVLTTLGVERPLRQIFLRDTLLTRGMALPLAMSLCAGLGLLRSLPFYWTPWLDPRFFFFAVLILFIRECTLCRLYLVSENLVACGAYQALVLLVEAFLLSDVLGPYLPAFHWISSSTGFYVLISFFTLLPYVILSLVKAPSFER